jgi:hypothetical protein
MTGSFLLTSLPSSVYIHPLADRLNIIEPSPAGIFMKITLLLVAMLGLASLSTGCASPAYSGGLPTIQFPEEKPTGENANNVVRTAHIESRQFVDDINSVFLMTPPSRLTKWHVR